MNLTIGRKKILQFYKGFPSQAAFLCYSVLHTFNPKYASPAVGHNHDVDRLRTLGSPAEACMGLAHPWESAAATGGWKQAHMLF